MTNEIWFWIIFNAVIAALLIVDLQFFHRSSRPIEIKEALLGCAFWMSLAALFNLGIYYFRGLDDALSFLTGYLIEYSLSIDNLFVFLLIFQHLKIPEQYLHKILFWGILGAIIMRTFFIVFGILLVNKFPGVLYIFGAFLIISGIRLMQGKGDHSNPEENFILRVLSRLFPISHGYEDGHFFIQNKKKRYAATSLFVALIAIEFTDLIFAFDSIPAILAITLDPFIAYTSNIFAILGLRSLYFAVSKLFSLFHYLNYGLALILIFIGIKMFLHNVFIFPIGISLGILFVILSSSILLSILNPKQN